MNELIKVPEDLDGSELGMINGPMTEDCKP